MLPQDCAAADDDDDDDGVGGVFLARAARISRVAAAVRQVVVSSTVSSRSVLPTGTVATTPSLVLKVCTGSHWHSCGPAGGHGSRCSKGLQASDTSASHCTNTSGWGMWTAASSDG